MSINSIEYTEKIAANAETPEMIHGASGRMSQPPTMVTIAEASEITHLSYYSLRRMCLENTIVHIRVGTKFLINLEKLIEYLNGNR